MSSFRIGQTVETADGRGIVMEISPYCLRVLMARDWEWIQFSEVIRAQ